MKFSQFGQKFGGESSIVNLMDDLGTALNENPDMIFMGGGNPAKIPAVEEAYRSNLTRILDTQDATGKLLGTYQSPQGDKEFRQHLASYLKRQYQWPLNANNIAICNGSQPAFFILYNLLAGPTEQNRVRRIHFPVSPEYLGYRDLGLSEGLFSATRPGIERLPNHLFKYRVDFSQLAIDNDVAALSISRPTNPTGNVITDEELAQLSSIAEEREIPLIIDGAYGLPFPGILFTRASNFWNENTVLALSLSKLGLPGIRTGIVIGSEELIQAFVNANTVINLAAGTLGPSLIHRLFANGELQSLSQNYIAPYYLHAAERTLDALRTSLAGLPFHIHKPEGAIFLWLWLEGLPISSQQLYQRLKARGVLVVPGESFFLGLKEDWQHSRECLRISYAQPWEKVRQGITIIADEVHRAYRGG